MGRNLIKIKIQTKRVTLKRLKRIKEKNRTQRSPLSKSSQASVTIDPRARKEQKNRL